MLKQTDNNSDQYGRTLTDIFFGYNETKEQARIRAQAQQSNNEKIEDLSNGSEIIFSEGKILNSEGKVIDGLDMAAKDDTLLQNYTELPIRQHVKINSRGVTDKTGKFDNEIVFIGSRFCFEIEVVAENESLEQFSNVLDQIQNESFRIGGGTRKGYGKIKVIELKKKTLDLTNPEELKQYLEKSSCLSENWNHWNVESIAKIESKDYIKYELSLTPEDFFLFGSGFGDDQADMTPVKARIVNWISNNDGKMSSENILIPATSVKGALAHRVAYHYNKIKQFYAGDPNAKVGKDNKAVFELFGSEGEKIGNDFQNQKRGNVIFSDVIEMSPKEAFEKMLNHVAIDRFTGGAIDGALFTEKTIYAKGKDFKMTILAKKTALEDNDVKTALEESLKDICKGLLPLGGGVNRGNGVFEGELKRNKEIIYSKKEDNL